MRWQGIMQLSFGCAVGFLAAAVINAETPIEKEKPKSTASCSSTNDAVHAEYERRIAELISELTSLRSRLASDPRGSEAASSVIPPPTASSVGAANPTGDFFQSAMDAAARAKAAVENQETEQLLAAGFSMERIEWIRQRSDELRVEVERKVHEGTGGPMALAYSIDQDLDLKNEIGEEEYDRYRQALGRPVGVGIEKVLPTSSAEVGGVKAGDQVITYAGKRVYNQPMLNHAMAESRSSGSVLIGVIRDGQRIQLVVPEGPLGVQVEDQVLIAIRNRVSSLSAAQ